MSLQKEEIHLYCYATMWHGGDTGFCFVDSNREDGNFFWTSFMYICYNHVNKFADRSEQKSYNSVAVKLLAVTADLIYAIIEKAKKYSTDRCIQSR